MPDLSNDIYRLYVERFSELPAEKQFHFASRLSQWHKDPSANKLLAAYLASHPISEKAAREALKALLTLEVTPQAPINHLPERLPFFLRYPSLYGLHQALFQVLHWLVHYTLDMRTVLQELTSSIKVDPLLEQLKEDVPALQFLSTYAVNTLYLHQRLVTQNEDPIFDRSYLEKFSPPAQNGYSTTLLIYFVTHCIIGETIFYARSLPRHTASLYQEMLAYIEPQVRKDLDTTTLDALLELAVAAKLCSYQSNLNHITIELAHQHFDPKRGYLVDPKRPDKNTLIAAEHRNVLFIMAMQETDLLSR